jgi:mono/diheme cytochrome c family protein
MRLGFILAGVLIATASLVRAQLTGDAVAGHALAERECARCHPIEARDTSPPNRRPPSFRAIANAPGMTGASLHAFLSSPHRHMPDLILSETEQGDLIAYIMAMREKR